MGQDTAGKLVGHSFGGVGSIVEGRDQGIDGRPSIGGPVHVADVDFVERRLADAEYERALLFQTDVGSAFDQVRSNAVGNTGQGANAAWHHDHSVTRIRTAR